MLVDAGPLRAMRELVAGIEHHDPTLGAMQYHRGLDWLNRFGRDARRVKKVHIPRAAALLSRAQLTKHPWVVLHELAHAYHDQVLDFEHEKIIAAYEQAKAAAKYENVLLYPGKRVRHDGLTNYKEYFAEGTEAYFTRNDFYPFVRADLKERDPGFHEVLEGMGESAVGGVGRAPLNAVNDRVPATVDAGRNTRPAAV